MTDAQKRARMAEIAELMKSATGEALDALVREVDTIMGFDDVQPDAEKDAAWELGRWRG